MRRKIAVCVSVVLSAAVVAVGIFILNYDGDNAAAEAFRPVREKTVSAVFSELETFFNDIIYIRDSKEEMNYSDNSHMERFSSDEIVITHNPITARFISLEDARFSLHGDNEKVFSQRISNPPTLVHNLACGSYYGSGDYQRTALYSERFFLPSADNQLNIRGSVRLADDTSQSLIIRLVDNYDGSVTDCIVPAVKTGKGPYHTAYYFDFSIGQLNPNDTYYIKFNTAAAGKAHCVDYTVSYDRL